MPDLLESIAYFLPLTYAVDALNRVVTEVAMSSDAWRDVWVVAGFIVTAVALGALTLRRKVK
jgi:ABC-2 type transport system permease protein